MTVDTLDTSGAELNQTDTLFILTPSQAPAVDGPASLPDAFNQQPITSIASNRNGVVRQTPPPAVKLSARRSPAALAA